VTRSIALTLAVLGTAGTARAQTPVPVPLTVSGNQAQGTIALPGGVEAELTLTFETVANLSPATLLASAALVDPADPALLLRLPPTAQVPGAFPVLVRVWAPPEGHLAFTGVYEVSLYTHNLELDPAAPQSLLKAPEGGPFQDITTREATGSYRVSGSGGGFSEFLVVVDPRPINLVVLGKFVALQATLVRHAASMPLFVFLTLQTRLAQARSLFEAGSISDALARLASFSSYALAQSGSGIPALWRAGDPRVNVAGLLRSGAASLSFSVQRSAGF
jgi:hypothetical protein